MLSKKLPKGQKMDFLLWFAPFGTVNLEGCKELQVISWKKKDKIAKAKRSISCLKDVSVNPSVVEFQFCEGKKKKRKV